MPSKAFHGMGCMQVCTCGMLQHRLEAARLFRGHIHVIGGHKSSINIMCNGTPLEQVKQFNYIGASFNEKGDSINEVKRG